MFDSVGPPGSADDAFETAVACLTAGIERADPARAVRELVGRDGEALVVGDERFDAGAFERIVVLGGGKGSDRVAAALVDALAEQPDESADEPAGATVEDGIVVVDEPADGVETGPVSVRVGDHPVPSARGVESAEAVRELAEAADEETLVLAVVSGGASALLPAPAGDVPLAALQSVTRDLLDAGASIGEVNAVRKHVSTLKGGQLAAAAWPANVATVVVSDVVGDDLSVIGSGPTAADGTTYEDALDVLSRYDVAAPAVRGHLEAGTAGEYAETPDSDHPCLGRTSYHVVSSARTAVDGAVDAAEDRGYDSCVLSTTIVGESREAGGFHAAVGREVANAGDPVSPPSVLVSAGETTVTVRGNGTGGPNQEFVLGAAVEFADGPAIAEDVEVAVAAVDTDGRDGSTDAAGAVLAGDSLSDSTDARAARDALAANDAYAFLETNDALLRSGASGTNVNDLRLLVVQSA